MNQVYNQLAEEKIKLLRSAGRVGNDETVYYSGDLLVAENVITKQRRILDENSKNLIESNQRLLKG